MIKDKSAAMYSYLLSKGNELDDDVTSEDLKYMLDMNVTSCQIDLYLKVIEMLSEGKSYEKIYKYIDSYKSYEYEELLEDQRTYVKSKIKRDLKARKNIEEKGDR